MKKLSMLALVAGVVWMIARGKKQERGPEAAYSEDTGQTWQAPVGAAASDTSPSEG